MLLPHCTCINGHRSAFQRPACQVRQTGHSGACPIGGPAASRVGSQAKIGKPGSHLQNSGMTCKSPDESLLTQRVAAHHECPGRQAPAITPVESELIRPGVTHRQRGFPQGLRPVGVRGLCGGAAAARRRQALRKRPPRPRHGRRSPAAGSRRLEEGVVPPGSVGRGSECAPRGAAGRELGGRPDRHPLGSRLSALGSRLSALGSRLSALGSRLSALGSRLSALGSRLSALGSRLSALGSRLSALGSRLSALGSRLSALGSRLSALGSRLFCSKATLSSPLVTFFVRLFVIGPRSGLSMEWDQGNKLARSLMTPSRRRPPGSSNGASFNCLEPCMHRQPSPPRLGRQPAGRIGMWRGNAN